MEPSSHLRSQIEIERPQAQGTVYPRRDQYPCFSFGSSERTGGKPLTCFDLRRTGVGTRQLLWVEEHLRLSFTDLRDANNASNRLLHFSYGPETCPAPIRCFVRARTSLATYSTISFVTYNTITRRKVALLGFISTHNNFDSIDYCDTQVPLP